MAKSKPDYKLNFNIWDNIYLSWKKKKPKKRK